MGGLADLLTAIARFESLSAEELRALRDERDRDNLARWKTSGFRAEATKVAGDFNSFCADPSAREGRRRAMGVPPELAETIDRDRLERDELRYQRKALNPLRRKLRHSAENFREAIVALIKAERKRPVEVLCASLDADRAAGNVLGVQVDAASEYARSVRHAGVNSTEVETAAATALLPWLIRILDGKIRKTQASRSRPTDIVKARATEVLQRAGLGRTGIARALINEGLESPSASEEVSRDRIAKRVRRSKRRGDGSGAKIT